jgi:hypothetical protein
VWDEPPSGASKIHFATPQERKSAEQQLQELQLTLDMIPPDNNNSNSNSKSGSSSSPVKDSSSSSPKTKDNKNKGGGGGGFLGRFRKKDRDHHQQQQQQQQKQLSESQDLNLQRAIARSIMDQGGDRDSPVVFYDPDGPSARSNDPGADYEDDDIALAKALSVSESAHTMSEEEMLQLALEQSKNEAERSNATAGVAGRPKNDNDEFHSFHAIEHTRHQDDNPPGLMEEDTERKMPALKQSPTSAATTADAFDPYRVDSSEQPAASPPRPFEEIWETKPSSPEQISGSATGKVGTRGRLFGRLTGGRKAMEDDAGLV